MSNFFNFFFVNSWPWGISVANGKLPRTKYRLRQIRTKRRYLFHMRYQMFQCMSIVTCISHVESITSFGFVFVETCILPAVREICTQNLKSFGRGRYGENSIFFCQKKPFRSTPSALYFTIKIFSKLHCGARKTEIFEILRSTKEIALPWVAKPVASLEMKNVFVIRSVSGEPVEKFHRRFINSGNRSRLPEPDDRENGRTVMCSEAVIGITACWCLLNSPEKAWKLLFNEIWHEFLGRSCSHSKFIWIETALKSSFLKFFVLMSGLETSSHNLGQYEIDFDKIRPLLQKNCSCVLGPKRFAAKCLQSINDVRTLL